MISQLFDTAAILVIIAAVAGYINHRFLKLPFAIGLMVAGLVSSLAVLLIDQLIPQLQLSTSVRSFLHRLDFSEALFHGMLGFLLFAGSLHLEVEDLLEKKWPILTLASVGVLISTLVVGAGSWWMFQLLGLPLPFIYCLLFGALISPTDPIAVIGIMRSAGVPKSVETKIAGESLFNDGIGVVLFSVVLAVAVSSSSDGHAMAPFSILILFLREVLGGCLLGLGLGYIVYRIMRTLDEPNLEILFSIALVMAITYFAFRLHLSGPLACVVAGLLIGNRGRKFAMSDRTRDSLDLVWGFVDEMLNALLFLIVGLEVAVMNFGHLPWIGFVGVIFLTLLGRFVSVSSSVYALKLRHEFTPGAIKLLTWGGLKGGISVALALSLPPFPGREIVLASTYAIVVFSILVQGLTMGPLTRRLVRRAESL